MASLTPIRSFSPNALGTWLRGRGQPAYRLDQIFDWLYDKWSVEFDAMGNLPPDLRRELAAHFRACSLKLLESLEADDGTLKWLFELADGETVETVLIRIPERTTVCVSTQVGCPVRCRFCASGSRGWIRDLTATEILEQVVWASHVLGHRVDNVVVMGIGEPLLNVERLLEALDAIGAPPPHGLGVGARHVTVSTSGIVPGIRRLAEAGRQWNLALSLHAPDDAGRARLIPDAHRYPLPDILEACSDYRERTGRLVTLEYTLVPGVNDRDSDLAKVARLARRMDAKINLIACNPTRPGHAPPDPGALEHARDQIASAGARVTIRRSRGSAIRAACGQLRRRRLQGDGLNTMLPKPGARTMAPKAGDNAGKDTP